MNVVTRSIRQLEPDTWELFAEVVERNNGIYGGCWCIGYHPECGQQGISHRAVKEVRVRTDRAHAALVVDDDGLAQGWCQYGSPDELSGIKYRRKYDQDPPTRSDWRITCIFVDKRHRARGRPGRTRRRDRPDSRTGWRPGRGDPRGHRRPHGARRFLFSATVELFEQYEFTRVRQVGKHAWIVSRSFEPAWRVT